VDSPEFITKVRIETANELGGRCRSFASRKVRECFGGGKSELRRAVCRITSGI
jgi:hypothetical protein